MKQHYSYLAAVAGMFTVMALTMLEHHGLGEILVTCAVGAFVGFVIKKLVQKLG